jgi:hypothetical protein
MAKNLVNGTNIIIEENGDNISMNLSSTYNTNLHQEISDSFKENNIYSTDETIIGTWIGKPIYRKVFTGIATGTTTMLDSSLTPSVITLVNCGGNVFQTSNTRHMVFSGYINANWYSGIYCAEGGLQLMLSSELAGGQYNVFIEYTKATD